jgi:hypothetical protein
MFVTNNKIVIILHPLYSPDWLSPHWFRFVSQINNQTEGTTFWNCVTNLKNLMRGSKTKNPMVWVRERTIPTERPPLVGEVIASFCGKRVPRGQRDGRFSRQEPLLFYQVAPQLYSRGWVDPVPDPLLFFFFSRKSGSAGNRTRASGSVAKNSWPLDHRRGQAVLYSKGKWLHDALEAWRKRWNYSVRS